MALSRLSSEYAGLHVQPSGPVSIPSPRSPLASIWSISVENQAASVLVIDDQAEVRQAVRIPLEMAGFDVVEACNGKQGLEQYRSSPADLVIADLLMPDTGGLEVILELTSEFPTVKVLAITGGVGGCDFLELAHLFGACRLLRKPFTSEELLQAVWELVEAEGLPPVHVNIEA